MSKVQSPIKSMLTKNQISLKIFKVRVEVVISNRKHTVHFDSKRLFLYESFITPHIKSDLLY